MSKSTGDESAQNPAGDSGADESIPAEDMSPFEADFDDQSELAKTAAKLTEAEEELARARADYYNLNQEYGNYVRRAKAEAVTTRAMGQQETVEALLSVLDDIEAARAAGELQEGPFAAIASKLEETLAGRFGLERFGQAGEDFDPQLHEALMAQTNPEVDHPVINQVLQPGYRMKDRVIRPTKVMVDNPQ